MYGSDSKINNIISAVICEPFGVVCPIESRAWPKSSNRYVHVLVDLLGDLVEVSRCHASYSFGQFFGVDSAFVVHEIVGDRLRDIVLGLVVQYLVVDSALGSLQFLIGDFIGVG